MDNLTILPIKEEEIDSKNKRDLHENLPDVYKAQLLSIVAPIRSGKSVLWNNLIHREEMFKDLFDNLMIISPTIANDKTSRFTYQKYKHCCHEAYSDKLITDLIDQQKEKMESNQNSSYCLILDDLCGQFSKHGKKGAAAIHFATRFRHYVNTGEPALVLCSTQKYKDLHPILRCNSTGVLISGNIKSQKELSAIVEDWADSFGGKQNFLRLFEQARTTPYAFLYLKLDTKPLKAYLNFTKLIWQGTWGDAKDEDDEQFDSLSEDTDSD